MTAVIQTPAEIGSVHHFNDRYFRLAFSSPSLARLAKPGQFVTVSLDRPGFPLLRRPFSIYRVRGNEVELFIKVVGRGTEMLAAAQPGEMISVLGPLGQGVFCIDGQRPHTLLVGGGIGMAPFLFLAESLGKMPGIHFELLFGGRTARDLVGHDPFDKLGIPCFTATEDGSEGHRGPATDLLRNRLGEYSPDECQVLACGPLPMLKAIAAICATAGVPAQVSLESLMACGMGACLGCVVPIRDAAGSIVYERVCHEGPVFDASRLAWEEM